MKKFITVAALVAAGTALASAATWTTIDLSTTSVESGSATLSDLGMTGTYSYDQYSWTVSFTLDVNSGVSGGQRLFATDTSNNDGLAVLVNPEGGIFNLSNYNSVHLGDLNNSSLTTYTSDDKTYADFTMSWDSVSEVMSVTNGSTTTSLDLSAEGSNRDTYLTYASLTGSSTFLSNDGNTPISNISISVCATSDIPEPSMFGVLAGLGALGLVAARRRRNRKA
ncbi:MAG: PEP-CTERM sorting domain-containing protein [Opitutae bacterium]|nr:PEP-CTERM sorting domain-containing protein [Opitutae bacterium]